MSAMGCPSSSADSPTARQGRTARHLGRPGLALLALGLVLGAGAPGAIAGFVVPGDLGALGQALSAQNEGADIDCTHPDVKDLPMCANAPAPPPPGAAPQGPKGPPNTKPTVGIAAHLWAFNRGVLNWNNLEVGSVKGEVDFLMRSAAGGFSVFMETRTTPASLSVEANLWFPKVERYRPAGEAAHTCPNCKWDVVAAILLVLKYRFKIGKWVAPYPLLGLGFGAIQSLYRGTEAKSHLGLSFATGIGVEGYPTDRVAPFFELRYQLVSGYSHEKEPNDVKEWLHYHAVVMALGVRFY